MIIVFDEWLLINYGHFATVSDVLYEIRAMSRWCGGSFGNSPSLELDNDLGT